jgi:hypothetical protein
MKLKCSQSTRYLTKDKYYKVSNSQGDRTFRTMYWVFEDDWHRGGWFSKELFESIEDKREQFINDITNDI